MPPAPAAPPVQSAPPVPPAPPAAPIVPVALPVPPAPAPPAPQPPAPAAPEPAAENAKEPEQRAEPTPAPAVQKPTGITGMIDPLPSRSTTAAHAGEAEVVEEAMDLDRTVVAPRRSAPKWVLELPDGTVLPLADDVVIGRKPDSIDGSATLEVPDRTRTLSKSHARLVREGERWTIEDLGSTNGLVLINEDGSESELSANVRVEATEQMMFGTLEVRLRPGGDAA